RRARPLTGLPDPQASELRFPDPAPLAAISCDRLASTWRRRRAGTASPWQAFAAPCRARKQPSLGNARPLGPVPQPQAGLACGLRQSEQMYPIETAMIRFLGAISLLFLATPGLGQAAPAQADPKAVAHIESGIVDCPGCQLQGANLLNTCVKA